jgi:hypothetical protein
MYYMMHYIMDYIMDYIMHYVLMYYYIAYTKNMDVSPRSFWDKGMEYCKRDGGCHKDFHVAQVNTYTTANVMRFKSHFGTSPGVCSYIWSLIYPSLHRNHECCGVQFFHLLWGLMFLKVYETDSVLAGIVGGIDEKTFRKWKWIIVKALSTLKSRVVSYLERFDSSC